MVICLERGADCLPMAQLIPNAVHHLLPHLNRLVLTFWYCLTQVVLEKRPLNRCSSSSSSCCVVVFSGQIVVSVTCYVTYF